MPSKRKKNKRRMRGVQAQRRVLEEQHVANLPVKASPGIAVSAPAKIPEAVPFALPIAVPTVETPRVEQKQVVKEPFAEPAPVKVDAPKPETVLLEQTPAEAEVQVPAWVTEEAPAIMTPPVAPSTVKATAVQEAEVHTSDTTLITTETEQMHDLCKPDNEVEVEALPEADIVSDVAVKVSVVADTSIPAPITVAAHEPVVEALASDQASAGAEPATETTVRETVVSVEEVITEIPEPEQVTEVVVSPAAVAGEEEDEDEELAEDAPEVPAEPVTVTEVPDTVPEAPGTEVKEAPATQDVADPLVDHSVTEILSVMEEIVAPSDTFSIQTESVRVTPAEPKPATVPAEEVVIKSEQTSLDAPLEEPKSEICDMPCQAQFDVEPVQLSSVETSVETALNGHIIPEVSTEG
uniref:calphotin isoform X2 n=1 Tax=Monopterus albus TaxID=43700 RepID=UPI0009B30FC6|nr:calphotin-like isoform X2 [Monopterus albus]